MRRPTPRRGEIRRNGWTRVAEMSPNKAVGETKGRSGLNGCLEGDSRGYWTESARTDRYRSGLNSTTTVASYNRVF